MWIPGSQTEMVVVTDSFVKIYDMRVDLLCPVYYFIVLTGKIKDATIAVTDEVCVCVGGGGVGGCVGVGVHACVLCSCDPC